MNGRFFLDTNILIYSFETREPEKQRVAGGLIERALNSLQGYLSWQVIQEFFNVARHKWETPMSPQDCVTYLQNTLLPLCTVYPGIGVWTEALRIQEETGYRFYDSLILASALHAGADILYSEDLQHGRRLGRLTVQNPFL